MREAPTFVCGAGAQICFSGGAENARPARQPRRSRDINAHSPWRQRNALTGRVPGSASQYEREWECDAWMKQHGDWDTPWLAIDDRAHWFRPECSDLLLTDSRIGFSADDQKTLRQMLRERT